MPKFFTQRENITDTQIIIDSEDAKHIKKVLRLCEGDTITVCDGGGMDYQAQICEILQDKIVCDIKSQKKCESESDVYITLYQGLPKAAKMDYIIQKNTELGVCRIVPVTLSRCVVKLDGAAAEKKKTERWQKIAYEAAKQSGRGVVPEVTMPMSLDEVLAEIKNDDLVFVPYECETQTRIKDAVSEVKAPKRISFIIGPEGGFDPIEIERIKAEGVKTVTLGKRILRTETAAEAVVAMLMYAYDQI